MKKKLSFIILFIIAFAFDQITKIIVDSRMILHDSIPVIDQYLRLSYVRNSGMAFGMSFGGAVFMASITGLIIAILIYLFVAGKIQTGGFAGDMSFVLILAGAFGNFFDRVRMGEVIDFIDMGFGFHRWPVYNLADIYVTVGVVSLIFINVFLIKNVDTTEQSS